MKRLDTHDRAFALGILARAKDATLASIRADGTPHASTVNFAYDELVLYAAIGIDSQKAHNIRLRPHIALTVNAPYQQWNEIQGMAIDGLAEIVSDPDEVRHASALLLSRFPQYAKFMGDTNTIPWPGMLYVRIIAQSIALLNYGEGFGHTTYFDVS